MNNRLIVRAITFFTGSAQSNKELEDEMNFALNTLNEVEGVLTKNNYPIFSKRVSLPGVPVNFAGRLLDYVEKRLLISIGYLRFNSVDEIVDLAYNGISVPILHEAGPEIEKAKLYSEVFHRASAKDPVAATRIAVGFHNRDFYTPYFPDSSSRSLRAIGLAFLYPKLLVEMVRGGRSVEDSLKEVFRGIHNAVKLVKESIALPVVVDYSLSPWMENSVAELYEVSGYSLLEPGALYYTWMVNKLIYDYSNKEIATGFNEVMLPYAEDSILMDYGAKGLIKAKDFLAYASTCVAGVDMLVVPEGKDKLTQLIASAMALANTKSRPLSLRVIPVASKPEDIIDLKRFGKVPVLSY
ncbi:MAG: DUF711 family protein [Desulfurococcaceae archaeon]